MNALNNLGIVLTVVFSVCLAALVFEILYVLWRRGRFRRNCGADGEFSSISGGGTTPSKELLYFFCWKNQTTRVEPDTRTPPAVSTTAMTDDADALVEEMLKLQGRYGPSRVLFTIKEEEREEMEVTENDESSTENELVRRKKRKMSSDDVCLEELAVANDHEVVDVEVDDITTPFWTPCASPQYYFTPSPSPSRDANLSPQNSGTGPEDSVVLGDSGENTMSFVSIEIHG